MATLERLVVELATDASEYHKGLNQASTATSSWGSKLAGLAGKAALGAMAAAGVAIAGIGVAGVKEFVGFQNSMNEVFTLLPGMTADAMGKMQEDVKGFAKEFGVLPKETVPALYQAISAGVPKDNVFDFLEVAQKAARGGVTSLETAVDGISSTVNAYGKDIISATQASDLMFTAVKMGKTTFDELSSSLFQVNPTAAALGVQFGDVTAALASMTAQGVPTSVATTQLRQLLVEVSKEGSKTADVFSQIAGKSFRQFVAEGGNTQDALKLLEQYAASTGVGISDLFGSVEAGNAALALTGKGTESFTANLAAMAGSTGATEAAFATMNGGIGATLDRLKATWNTTLLDIGEKAAPAFSLILGAAEKALPVVAGWFVGVADAAAKGVEWIQANWPGISETVQGVVDRVTGLFAGVLGPSLDGAQSSFAWVVDWVQENLPLMRKTVETVVGAITKFWDEHGAKIMKIVGTFMSIVTTLFDTYLKNAFDIVKAVMQFITGDFEGAGETLKGIAQRTWDAVVGIFEKYIEMAKAVITEFDWAKLGNDAIKLIGDGLSAAGHFLWDAAKEAGQKAIDKILEFDWAKLGKDIIDGITGGITGAAQGLADAAKQAAQAALTAVQDFLGIQSPSKVMADEVGRPMAHGIGEGFRRAMAGLSLAVAMPMLGGLEMPSLGGLSVPVGFDVAGLELPKVDGLSVPVDFDFPEVDVKWLRSLTLPAPKMDGLSVPVDFDIPEVVLPPMTQEVALDFASGRSSGFDVLGNVFSSRDMIAGLKQAGERAARMAEQGAAQLATLRAGMGQGVDWAKELIAGLRSESGDEQENSVQRLEWVLGQLQGAIDFDFSPEAALPDVLGESGGAGERESGRAGERGSGGAGQTNHFTFNITATSEAEAKGGVLAALRQAGVAFA